MFNSTILDVAIGMIFVYLLLSLMCSAANELIELWLKNRAADLERGLSLAGDPQKITADDLHLTPPPEEVDAALPAGDKWPLQDYLDRVERSAINEALEKTRYNRTAAAKLLGITFRAMRYRMERLGIK